MVRVNPHIKKRIIRKAGQSICRMKIAALGFNRNGDCVMTSTNRFRFVRKGGGEHAEQIIMKEAKKKGIVRILICRIGRAGDLLPIDPCPKCQSIADKLNIKIETIPK